MLIETSIEEIDLLSLSFLKRLTDSRRFPLLLLQDESNNLFVVKLFSKSSKSFRNEACLQGIVHPNLISIYLVEEEMQLQVLQGLEPAAGVLMEYAQNGDLWDLLRDVGTDLSDSAIRTIFGQILDAIEFLHSNGIAHMDIKPENILLGADFSVKVADFDQSTSLSEKPVTSKGTRGYRAPEVMHGNCLNAIAADVFSLGVTLFYMKARVAPFEEGKTFEGMDMYKEFCFGDNSRFWNFFRKVKNDANYFHYDFINLIERMLTLEPEERLSIAKIRESQWFIGPRLDQKTLKNELFMLKTKRFVRKTN